jgi:methylase of polypeptide subunit release factors
MRLLSDKRWPCFEDLLKEQPYDPEPARALIARHEALEYPYKCTLNQMELEIDKGVFCPTLTNVTPFMLTGLHYRLWQQPRVLDGFTGSGALAIYAALFGCQVVGFDKSNAAVNCARKNALLNGVSDLVDIREGTVTETMTSDDVFDLILANPPLIPGDPKDPLESALFDTGLQATTEFIATLPGLLAKQGTCLLVTSDVIERKGYEVNIAKICRDNKLDMQITAELHRPYESYRLHTIKHSTLKSRLRSLGRDVLEAHI